MRSELKWTWVVAVLLAVAACSTKRAEPEAAPPGPSRGPVDAAMEADLPATGAAPSAAAKEAAPTPVQDPGPPAEEAVPDATEEADWSAFSLAEAMRGLQGEPSPYSADDIKEPFS